MIIHLTPEYEEDTRFLDWGKYDSPMAKYLDLKLMGDADEEVITGDCEGYARYGKRVQFWNTQGFVSCMTYKSQDEAKAAMPVLCEYDEQDDQYWHCEDVSISKTQCCGFHYCIEHAWLAEEHETAGVPLLNCEGAVQVNSEDGRV